MSKQDNLTDFLTDVADAIREMKGSSEKINPQNFSNEIRSIESGGIVEDKSIYKLNLPANYGVKAKNNGLAESKDYYTLDSLPIVNLVVKFLIEGNIFDCKELLILKRDDNNYLGILVDGYDFTFVLKINGTVMKSVKYGQTSDLWKAVTTSLNWVVTIDSVLKRFIFKTKNYNGTYDNTFIEDISDWEIDLLDEFKVVTEIGKVYIPSLGSKFFIFNGYPNDNEYLDNPLTADNYSPFDTTNHGTDVEINNLTLQVGGTRVETISSTHVVNSYSLSSYQYFPMGCSATGNYNEGHSFACMVRFTDVTEETSFYAAAGAKYIDVFDENQTHIFTSDSAVRAFKPEQDKWYIIVAYGNTGKNISYSSLYAYQMKGAGKVEVKALYVSNVQKASLGSLNWDGEYFTGYIPFKGTNIKFEKVLVYGGGTPLYSTRITNGQVEMWDGAAWKQITN